MKRGLFIVFEGSEKGGKKTQSRMLADALTQITGKETLYIHFPDKSTTVGKLIERYNNGELKLGPREAHLLFTANRWERQSEISAALSAGINVVTDRYSYSGVAYTAARINPLSNAEWSWCRQTERGLLQPDVIFCLVPTDFLEIATREGFGQRSTENPNFQMRVLLNYSRLSSEMEAELSESGDACDNKDGHCETDRKPKLWHWIQATGLTVDDTHTCLMSILDPLL